MYMIAFNPLSNPLEKQYAPTMQMRNEAQKERTRRSWDLLLPLTCPK